MSTNAFGGPPKLNPIDAAARAAALEIAKTGL